MIIGKIAEKEIDGAIQLAAPITLCGETRTCFYTIPIEYADLLDTSRSDSFLLSLVTAAMLAGEDIQVEGKVSERLFYQLCDTIIPVMNVFNPRYRIISLKAEELSSKRHVSAQQRGIGTGLSGGIDSFTCIWNHFIKPPSDEHKVTHFFFFNVGAHGMAHSDADLKKIEDKFRARYQQMKITANELGLPLIPVNSNVHSFFQVGHLENCSFVSPGAALLMQRGIGRYYLASDGQTFHDKYHRLANLREQWDVAMIDPLTVPYMSTENMRFEPTETHLSRIQKTMLVADFEVARRHLNVCSNYDAMEYNCSCCEKCLRTLTTLEIIGKIDSFAKVFDLDVYRKQARKHYFAKVIARQNKELYYHGIMAAAKERGFDLREHTTFPALLWEHFKDSALHNALRKIPGLRPVVQKLKRL
ncbi:MAG: hypothetical protein GX945_08000 [Lentisphaerae bacterium]|jgi:hypothetical protein|nr:hypothetical protein [Lentisphaerota bacterium]